MAGEITINKRKVLDYTSGFLETIYYELEKVIEKKNIQLNKELDAFINELYLICRARFSYFDITEFLTTYESVDEFLAILKETIENLALQLNKPSIEDLWKLYSELTSYREELK